MHGATAIGLTGKDGKFMTADAKADGKYGLGMPEEQEELSEMYDMLTGKMEKASAELTVTSKNAANSIELINKKFEKLTKKKPETTEEYLQLKVDLEKLAKETEMYSGADLEGLVKEAIYNALRESNYKKTKVKMKHFEKGLEIVKPSLTHQLLSIYERFEKKISAKRDERDMYYY